MKNNLLNKIDKAIQYFNKELFLNSFSSLLKDKYKEKNNKNLDERDFTNNCIDYLISPIADNAKKYGILFLFTYIKKIILDYAFFELNNSLKEKKNEIKSLFEKSSEENYNRFMKEIDIDKYKEESE